MEVLLRKQCAEASKASDELREIANAGFFEKDGCFFLNGLMRSVTNINVDIFLDKTGCECFFNSLHVVDYMPNADIFACLNFLEMCFESWKNSFSGDLVSIVSLSEDNDFVIKLHLSRPGESWLCGDLNEYEEAVLLIKGQVWKRGQIYFSLIG